MNEEITVKVPMGTLTLSKSDIERLLDKLNFYSEIVPILVCPEFYEHSDLHYNKDQCIEYLKDYAEESKDSVLQELFKFMEGRK